MLRESRGNGVLSDRDASESPRVESSGNILCVDLDGTILKTDLVWESIISLSKSRPLALLVMPFWLIHGKARFKRWLAERASLDVSTLPYRPEVLAFLREQREQGRYIVLATAADGTLAERVANHLGLFDEVHGSTEGTNLKGKEKAAFLQRRFPGNFDYIGDSRDDLPVWAAAGGGYIVGDAKLAREAASVVTVKGTFETDSASILVWLKALRGFHWAKNLLMFLPLVLAHKTQFRPLLATTLGFLIFSTCASSIYILNDLLDLHSDRAHHWKAQRPFASGETSIPAGLAVSSILISATLALGSGLSLRFLYVLLLYVALTIWYSVKLKRVPILDVFILSGFYILRLLAGSVITSTPLSDWFLAFSFFFFFSLAAAKRYSELVQASETFLKDNSGRGYVQNDRDLFFHLGVASSFAAVVILAVYVHSTEVLSLYRKPELLLLVCPMILYLLSRIWFRAQRGELDQDPVVLSVLDPVTYVVAIAILAVLLFSS
jgi:4-hydroxybenzoate polyprenyltransferase/phosphoserine phosphatase